MKKNSLPITNATRILYYLLKNETNYNHIKNHTKRTYSYTISTHIKFKEYFLKIYIT